MTVALLRITLASVSAALGLAAHTPVKAPPPPAHGKWRQLGPAVTSRPGKQLRLFRTATPDPHRLAIVATSTSKHPIRLHWYSWCEFMSDDDRFEEHQHTLTAVHTITAYPPVFDGATLCNVSVYARAGPGAVVTASVFRD